MWVVVGRILAIVKEWAGKQTSKELNTEMPGEQRISKADPWR
jgi:hypothetical protein